MILFDCGLSPARVGRWVASELQFLDFEAWNSDGGSKWGGICESETSGTAGNGQG